MTGALSQARDRLRDLLGRSDALQAQADDAGQALERAQRDASSGTGNLKAVSAAQQLADAARGVLGLHERDVAAQHDQVGELERAQAAAQLIADARAAQASSKHAAQEAAQLAADIDATLSAGRARYQALEAEHRAAAGRALWAAQQHAAAVLGLSLDDVRDAMRDNPYLQGPLAGERRAAVRAALDAFGQLTGTDTLTLYQTAQKCLRTLPTDSAGLLEP